MSKYGQDMLDAIQEAAEDNTGERIYSRVLKDAVHLMDITKIPLKHGLAKEFRRRYRETVYVVDAEDKPRVEGVLRRQGMTYDQKMAQKPKYILKCVRRSIPPPSELFQVGQITLSLLCSLEMHRFW